TNAVTVPLAFARDGATLSVGARDAPDCTPREPPGSGGGSARAGAAAAATTARLAAAAVSDTGRERCFIDTHLPGRAGSAKGSWMGPSLRSRPGGTQTTRAR